MEVNITHSKSGVLTVFASITKDYSKMYSDLIANEDDEFAHSALDGLDFVELDEDGLKKEIYDNLREMVPDIDWGGGVPYVELEPSNDHYELLENFDRKKAIDSLKSLKIKVNWSIHYELSTPILTKIEGAIEKALPNKLG